MAGLIDLHTHTSVSDGDYSPSELLSIAHQRGVSVISITDHDTTDAYNPALFDEAASCEMRLVPGIELSTIDEQSGQKIHVLGLFIDPYNGGLKELCSRLRRERLNLARVVGNKLEQYGIILRVDELIQSGEIITKAHIARDVIMNPANKKALEDAHGHVPLQGEFIESWLIKGCPAFVPRTIPLLTHQAIKAVHVAGGVASCAHPSFNVMKGFPLSEMFELIIRNEFDAVEAVNIQYDKEKNDSRFDMVEKFTKFATENNFLISGGSDFHSDNTNLWGARTELGLGNELHKVAMKLLDMLEDKSSVYKRGENPDNT